MMRNDYRRALILLRSNASSYSGHVRLERRTLMGSMYFLVQAPNDCPALHAVLVGRDRNGYYACDLGQMQRDSRGQAVLSYSFDPRNICGRELEQYQLICVSCGQDAAGEILLCGNINGHADMDWNRVREAMCALNGGQEKTPVQEEAPPAALIPEAQEEIPPVPEEIQKEIATEALEEIQQAQEETMGEETPGSEDEEDNVNAEELLEAMGVDFDLPWPQSIDPVRLLFANGTLLRDAPDAEYVYISAPMPEESGYDYCAVGVLVENGNPVSLRYGLPAAWTAEAPAGLEDYSWVGDQNRGWWVIQVDVGP